MKREQSNKSAPDVPLRRYRIASLQACGGVAFVNCKAPALPAFESAFAVLGRGTMLQTPQGQTAVEDLAPGDSVRLQCGRFAPLVWHGMITLMPAAPTGDTARQMLTRVIAGALGPGRPTQDLLLGFAARLYHCTTSIAKMTGGPAAYIPACDFVDGNQFIALRPTAPVDLYQIGFARHETFVANGLGIESLHPGTAFDLGLRGAVLAQYRALFPHLPDLQDAGLPAYPRLRLADLAHATRIMRA